MGFRLASIALLRPPVTLSVALACATLSPQANVSQSVPAVADLVRDRELLTPLDGLWRFHPGDNQAFAAPSFDDSSWALIHANHGWNHEGYEGLSGFAWYRTKLVVPANLDAPLAIFLPDVSTNYQLFIDGSLMPGCDALLSNRNLPPKPVICPATELPLPRANGRVAHTFTIALRVWQWPTWASYHSGGPSDSIYVGSARLVEDRDDLHNWGDKVSLAAEGFMALLECIGVLASVSLFVMSRQDKEYLWFSIMLASDAAAYAAAYWARLYSPYNKLDLDAWNSLTWGLLNISSVAFFYRLLRGRLSWLFYAVIVAIVLFTILDLTTLTAFAYRFISVGVANVVIVCLQAVVAAWIVQLVVRRAIQRETDALLLLVPILIGYSGQFSGLAGIISVQLGWGDLGRLTQLSILTEPYPVGLWQLQSFLFFLGVTAVLLLRFSRSRTVQQRLSAEFQAARNIQHILIPDQIPDAPGFQIKSVYTPFGEVGGDFFQLLPQPDESILVVIGDVSGKGMPAALTVSLLVGTLRTLAHYTQSPGEILTAMNQRMLTRSNGGFTTCLVVCVGTDGTMKVANAGHIAPYLNGNELSTDSGFPLGISAEASYPESEYQFVPGDQLTLLTDGVVEARNKSGELFGFDRTAFVSTQRAEEIARTAQAFGQDDDITVVVLHRLTDSNPRTSLEHPGPVWSPSTV